jgi:hypothetical protein
MLIHAKKSFFVGLGVVIALHLVAVAAVWILPAF